MSNEQQQQQQQQAALMFVMCVQPVLHLRIKTRRDKTRQDSVWDFANRVRVSHACVVRPKVFRAM